LHSSYGVFTLRRKRTVQGATAAGSPGGGTAGGGEIQQVWELFGDVAADVARHHIMSGLRQEGWTEGDFPVMKRTTCEWDCSDLPWVGGCPQTKWSWPVWVCDHMVQEKHSRHFRLFTGTRRKTCTGVALREVGVKNPGIEQ